jgi:D-alanyl-D-alanine carboxypeptidase
MRRLLATIVVLLGCALPAHAAPPPEVGLAAYIVADGRDGRVLAQHDADAPRAIASITKMMTVYLALRAGALSKTYTVPVAATRIGESSAGLRAGDRVTGRDLLEGLLVPSANDAAETLAIGIDGSEDAFVDRMNRTARRLGMRDTAYRAPYGLDTPGQHSTAADQLILARLLMRDGRVRSIAKLRSAVVDGRRLRSSNTLLGRYAGLDGVKTGHTGQAGWCLAASAKRSGRRIFVVGLGAADEASRNREIAKLLDWGFAQLHPVTAVLAGAPAGTVPLPYGGTVDARVATTLRLTLRPGERLRLRYRVASVHLPLAQGAPVGQVDVLVGSRVVASAPLVTSRAVAAPGLFDRLGWFADHLFDPFGF